MSLTITTELYICLSEHTMQRDTEIREVICINQKTYSTKRVVNRPTASARSVSNSSPVHVFEPLFWTGQLSDNFQLKDRAIFHGSIFNADPRAPCHVTSCLQLMLFRSMRAICELKGILMCIVEGSGLYKYILVGQ